MFGNGVLEDVVTDAGKKYDITVRDVEPGRLSMLRIRNGQTTSIEGSDISDTMRLLLEIRQRHAFWDVTSRWPGEKTSLADVLGYFDRARAFTGRRVMLPGQEKWLYSDFEDFLACQLAELIHTTNKSEFMNAAAEFRRKNRYAQNHAIYFFNGAVYDDRGKWIGHVGGNLGMLEGFHVFAVTADNIRIAALHSADKPHYLREVGVPYNPV